MTNATQRILFTGGVSQQPDTLKLTNQVTESINGYPDLTFGLIKRSGGQFINELKNGSGTVYSPDFFDNGKWFSIFRDSTEKYVGCIKGANVYIWSLLTGAPQTVNLVGSAAAYLTGTLSTNYSILSVNDYTFITNKTVTVAAQATPAAPVRNKAFVRITALIYNSTYNVVVDGVTKTYTSPVDATAGVLTVTQVAAGLVAQLNTIAGVTATAVGSGVHISKTAAFSVSVSGGNTGDALTIMQDSVSNISLLPLQCVHEYTVRVANTAAADEDDYYVKFQASNGVSGAGVWQECLSPAVSPGFTAASMPHQLRNLGGGVFELGPVAWDDRLVGDDLTNPQPSFVTKKINSLFFFRNRLGALSGNNLILSQSGDFFNFGAQTALTVSDNDPIDESVPTTRPAELFATRPVSQGLILFSPGENFLLASSAEALTPTTIRVRSLSRYEFDPLNDPCDLGTTTAFLTKSPAYTRVFEIETLGNDENPVVSDLSKVVPEWIPATIDSAIGAGQNGLLSLASVSSPTAYMFSFYSEGTQRLNRAWFKWQLPGSIQHQAIDADVYWAVTKQQRSLVISRINLTQSPSTSTLLTTDGLRVDPRLDFWKTNLTGTYDDVTSSTKIYLPYLHDDSLTPCVLTGNSNTSTPTYANAGVIYYPTVANDGGGWYVTVTNADLSTSNIIVGYTYNFKVTLPELFFRTGNEAKTSDFSADLTIARIKFTLGLTSDVEFAVTPKGSGAYTYNVGVRFPNEYILNDISFVRRADFTVPIYQKNSQYTLSVQSSTPLPVSLIAAQWEGRYNPTFYKRA
jgi:hypothetical protein